MSRPNLGGRGRRDAVSPSNVWGRAISGESGSFVRSMTSSSSGTGTDAVTGRRKSSPSPAYRAVGSSRGGRVERGVVAEDD
jgi:hypothetical protein